MRTIAVIPARLASTRLPRKALAEIAGEPMIAHVVRAVLRAPGLDAVYVATDAIEIADAAERAGARSLMTSESCRSGTDRVAEAVRPLDADFVLNVQGDEPLLPPSAVGALADALRAGASTGIELATLARPLERGEESQSQVVKVVLAEDSSALYFSRSLVPFPRDPNAVAPLAHVGLYGYTKRALLDVSALAPTALERAEGLEQLRFLGHGRRMLVATGPWRTQAVDTPEDLARVRTYFERQQQPGV